MGLEPNSLTICSEPSWVLHRKPHNLLLEGTPIPLALAPHFWSLCSWVSLRFILSKKYLEKT